MRLFVIGDEDTVAGFRMAGVEGTVVKDRQEAADALHQAEQRQEAVLILPQRIAGWVREDIDRIRFGAEQPLIVEVPGREGPTGEAPSLFRLIREAVGIRIEG